MTKPRDEQVSLDDTPFYHCYVRCVRRAYLCGVDSTTGHDYAHRKQWLVSRLRFLSYVYAIDICAYAIMSNHYHVVLHVDKTRADNWDLKEVAERWMQLYRGSPLVDRWLQDPEGMDSATMATVEGIVEEWRKRLHSISWFMRGVNETIARMANEEEGCKGRFWEGRFKSQALLDEAALLSCMAYVDLNPVRAGMEKDLIDSDFTSIQQRLCDYVTDKNIGNKQAKSKDDARVVKNVAAQAEIKKALELDTQPEGALMAFDGSSHTSIHCALPFTLEAYFALVDETGRCLRDDKRGHISPQSMTLVAQFQIDPGKWIEHVRDFGRRYGHCAGSVHQLKRYAERSNQRWCKGVALKTYLA